MTQRKRLDNDLQQRVFYFGLSVCKSLRQFRPTIVTRSIVSQLVRSSTSPALNYAEARAAESRRDFVHKMQLCLKELRETRISLAYLSELADDGVDRSSIRNECDELTAIFVASIRTAKRSDEIKRREA